MTLQEIKRCCGGDLAFYRARNIAAGGGVQALRRIGQTLMQAEVMGEAACIDLSGRGRCTCGGISPDGGMCVHIAALLIHLQEGDRGVSQREAAESRALAFLNQLDARPSTPEAYARLRVALRMERGETLVSLTLGVTRMYVVKSVPALLDALAKHRPLVFGKGFTLDPLVHGFTHQDARVLDALRAAHEDGLYPRDPRYFPLLGTHLRRLLFALGGTSFELITGGRSMQVECALKPPPVEVTLSQDGENIRLTSDAPALVPMLPDFSFALDAEHERVVFIPPAKRAAYRALAPRPSQRGQAGEDGWLFTPAGAQRLVSEALPMLSSAVGVRLDPELDDKLVRHPMLARAYLDRERSGVSVRIEFAYGDIVFPAFAGDPDVGGRLVVRDAAGERDVVQVLEKFMFTVRPGAAALEGDEEIYGFLMRGVAELQRVAEVFTSEAFAAIRPRRAVPRAKLSARGSGMFSHLRLEMEGVDESQTRAVLEAMREKREWIRLPDGAFVSLEDDPVWAHIIAETEGEPEAEIPRARALALGILAGRAGLAIEMDEGARLDQTRAALAAEPTKAFKEVLRSYQKRGFEWMWAMADLGLGGVLADDMGLGKTVQVIALIDKAREQNGGAPSLVVVPTSLTHNWTRELERFAPHFSVVALEGSPAERRALLDTPGVDVFIASYAQLRRDEKLLDEMAFRYVILDEAQQVKNAFSVGARAVRRIEAESRFALTGTPMENHPGELWAVFDFVLPGLLGDLSDFMSAHAGGKDADIVRQRIRPFIMRRLKQEVLSELPEKIDHLLMVDLPEEQMAVYRATLLKARQTIDEEYGGGGGGQKSRFALLAALTRLRQACCHPALYVENYHGASGKLEVLCQILEECRENGHRVLVFSQFTAMLALIQKRLDEMEMDYFYLDGKTPAKERMDRVSSFNAGERGAFLLSLKAGGVGLNLTGADTVIHFDPWWNPAAEDQASDRTHRIGQSRAVHVMRLVARGTVEEKVLGLQAGKRELFEKLVATGEVEAARITPMELYKLLTE